MSGQLHTMFKNDPLREGSDKIQLERLIAKAAKYWPSFAICVLISLLLAYIYLKYTTPFYHVHAKVLIKEDKKNSASEGQVFEELGISTGVANVDNEIEIFKSRVLMQQTVRNLHLNVAYYLPGKLKEEELYGNEPFKLNPLFNDTAIHQLYSYKVRTHSKGYTIELPNKTISANWSDTIILPIGRAYLSPNPEVAPQEDEIIVKVYSADAIADKYLSGLDVAAVNKQVSIINITMQDNVPHRGEDVLNELIKVYTLANIEDRNRVSDSTMAFIDDRLSLVSNELTGVEQQIAGFKQENNLTDLKDQSKLLVDNTSEYAKQLTQQEVQMKILESLEKYVQGRSHRIVPSSLLLQDPNLSKIIDKYNTLEAQRQALLVSQTQSNPYIENIDQQLETLRSDMRSSLGTMKAELQVTIDELRKRTGYFSGQIKAVPQQERIFLEYSRQQNIKQELYLYLLKKKEETAISKSSNVANSRVIEPARKDGRPFAPSHSQTYLIAFAIGVLLPGTRVLLKELFNLKVTSREDITANTTMAILGEISHNQSTEIIAVSKDSRTALSEQFRALRTNLQFLFTSKGDKTILITSSMSGEGKSFIAINLANTLALSNKKVLLMELDLRKPKVSEHLNLQYKLGFTDYAIGKATYEQVIIPSGVSENFFVLPSGSIPPNPSELIMLPNVEALFENIKSDFDYIIMDTAPVGLVTDAQLLSRYADATLFVIRQGYTYKEQVRFAEELHASVKMPKMSIVVNDVKMGRGSVYGYGYGTYGNGYYSDEPGNLSDRLKSFRRRAN